MTQRARGFPENGASKSSFQKATDGEVLAQRIEGTPVSHKARVKGNAILRRRRHQNSHTTVQSNHPHRWSHRAANNAGLPAAPVCLQTMMSLQTMTSVAHQRWINHIYGSTSPSVDRVSLFIDIYTLCLGGVRLYRKNLSIVRIRERYFSRIGFLT